MQGLKHIQAYIKSLFCARKIPNVQLAGKLKNFIENWKILTNDTEILSLVVGLKYHFMEFLNKKTSQTLPNYVRKKRF